MKIEKNQLVAISTVFNKDIQLGVIAYSVAEMARFAKQAEKKVNSGEMEDEEYNKVFEGARKYIHSAHTLCKETGYDWEVCVLLSRENLDRFLS